MIGFIEKEEEWEKSFYDAVLFDYRNISIDNLTNKHVCCSDREPLNLNPFVFKIS